MQIKCEYCGSMIEETADRQQDFLLASIIRNQKHLVFIRMATSSLYTKTRQTANVPSAIRARMKLMLSMNFI